MVGTLGQRVLGFLLAGFVLLGLVACGGSSVRHGSSGTGGSGGSSGTAGSMSGGAGGTATCSSASIGSMCVVGLPTPGQGVDLVVGMPLRLRFQPFGCYSSSCTRVVSATCGASTDGDDFVAQAAICLDTSDRGMGCTDDCGGGGVADCDTGVALMAGTHTVRYDGEFDLSVTFTVPSNVPETSLCDFMDL